MEKLQSAPVSAFATVAQNSKFTMFTAKIDFSDRAFCVTISDADIGSLKSLHTLIDKYLGHMLVNRSIQNFELFGKNG